ncbi:hypothetical protein ACIRG5_28425 [Lentzea sp. NPDC102401]|uniref:hypothetical protein n=1 Tax=Lentzea sp. NPDC102401 TaxID=3364128 RepID=UPI0037FEA08C
MTAPEDVDETPEAGASVGSEQTAGRADQYRHDPAFVPGLASLADICCEEATDLLNASLNMRALAAETDPPLDPAGVEVVFNTFWYRLTPAAVDEVAGASLEPIEGPSFAPFALREAGEDIRQLWLALADQVTHPVMRARCWDIAFTLKLLKNGRDTAEKAGRAYLETIGTALGPRELAAGLLRGRTLARQVGLVDLEQEIAAAMIDVVEDVLSRDEDPYGAIPLLGALIAPPPRGRSAAPVDPKVDQLLDQALAAFPQVHVIEDVAVLVRKRAADDPDRAERANRHLIDAMLAEADGETQPMLIRWLFSQAATRARSLGLTDLEKIAVAKLQAAPALTWETTKLELNFPSELFDAYLPGFDTATDWRGALGIWLHPAHSPTGSHRDNKIIATRTTEASAIMNSITTVVFRSDDLPARTLSAGERFNRELTSLESVRMGSAGKFAGNALFRIRARFGIPPRADLEEFLRSFGAAPSLVTPLATALQLYWVGEYDAAVHLAVPKIEAAVRALLMELNEPVFRTQAGDTSGMFPGLGSLLPSLVDNGFDPDWERFLRTFLLGEGSNVRNLTAHGFLAAIDPVNAALALQACAVMVLLTTDAAVARDSATVKATLASPAGSRPRRSLRKRIVAAAVAAWFELRRT